MAKKKALYLLKHDGRYWRIHLNGKELSMSHSNYYGALGIAERLAQTACKVGVSAQVGSQMADGTVRIEWPRTGTA